MMQNRPTKQKIEKNFTPIDRHRKEIGEFQRKTQHKLESKEPKKISDIELGEGTKVFKILMIMLVVFLISLGLWVSFMT